MMIDNLNGPFTIMRKTRNLSYIVGAIEDLNCVVGADVYILVFFNISPDTCKDLSFPSYFNKL